MKLLALVCLLIAPSVGLAQITLDHSSRTVYVIETTSFDVSVTVEGGPGLHRDYVAIYSSGARLQWKYLDNTNTLLAGRNLKGGRVTFTGLTPGSYEVRFLKQGTTEQIGSSQKINLVPRLIIDEDVGRPATVVRGGQTVEIVRGADRETVRVLPGTEIVRNRVAIQDQTIDPGP